MKSNHPITLKLPDIPDLRATGEPDAGSDLPDRHQVHLTLPQAQGHLGLQVRKQQNSPKFIQTAGDRLTNLTQIWPMAFPVGPLLGGEGSRHMDAWGKNL